MVNYYIKRAIKIIQEEGVEELVKEFTRFMLRSLDSRGHHRFRFHTLKNKFKNRVRYDATSDPYSTIKVNPKNINLRQGDDYKFSKYKGLGQVKQGEWDKNRDVIVNNPVYKGLKQRFEEKICWEDTMYVQNQVQKYEHEGKCGWGHETPKEFIENRCEFVDNLHQSMKNNGYIHAPGEYTNKDMDDTNLGRGYDRLSPIDRLEVLIVISREGEYILREGHHRTTIARILDIDSIPVNVLCRHQQWQELRDDIYNNGLSEEHEDLRDHPDLQDILR